MQRYILIQMIEAYLCQSNLYPRLIKHNICFLLVRSQEFFYQKSRERTRRRRWMDKREHNRQRFQEVKSNRARGRKDGAEESAGW